MTGRLIASSFLILLVSAGVAPAKQREPIERKWGELSSEGLIGKQALLHLRNGVTVEGKCLSIRADSMTLKTREPGNGERRIEAVEIERITISSVSRGRRWGLAVVGGLGAMFVSALAMGSLREGSAANRQIATIYGSGGAGAVGGYLFGASLDGRARKVIVIVP